MFTGLKSLDKNQSSSPLYLWVKYPAHVAICSIWCDKNLLGVTAQSWSKSRGRRGVLVACRRCKTQHTFYQESVSISKRDRKWTKASGCRGQNLPRAEVIFQNIWLFRFTVACGAEAVNPTQRRVCKSKLLLWLEICQQSAISTVNLVRPSASRQAESPKPALATKLKEAHGTQPQTNCSRGETRLIIGEEEKLTMWLEMIATALRMQM